MSSSPSIPTPPRAALALTLALTGLASLACRSQGNPEIDAGAARLTEASARRDHVRPAVPPPLTATTETAYAAALLTELAEPVPENHPSLHNVFDLSANIVSGSEPEGEEAFRLLNARGVQTILSVDGKVPEAELAAKYGLRYVHVPIQYKGITEDELAKIIKTFREQEGPFYVHCFHGKHRGPAAAALGRLVLDAAPREQALAEMRQWCGTAEAYEGLYATIAYRDLPDEDETQAFDWDFPSAEPLEGVAGGMVLAARSNDHLKAASKNGWQPTEDHPDLNALNEATKLADVFERTASLDEMATHPEDFRAWMRDATTQSAELRDYLMGLEEGSATLEDADRTFKDLSATCKACHAAYRD